MATLNQHVGQFTFLFTPNFGNIWTFGSVRQSRSNCKRFIWHQSNKYPFDKLSTGQLGGIQQTTYVNGISVFLGWLRKCVTTFMCVSFSMKEAMPTRGQPRVEVNQWVGDSNPQPSRSKSTIISVWNETCVHPNPYQPKRGLWNAGVIDETGFKWVSSIRKLRSSQGMLRISGSVSWFQLNLWSTKIQNREECDIFLSWCWWNWKYFWLSVELYLYLVHIITCNHEIFPFGFKLVAIWLAPK